MNELYFVIEVAQGPFNTIKEDWIKTVDRMVSKGAVIKDEERGALIKFLAETYGV